MDDQNITRINFENVVIEVEGINYEYTNVKKFAEGWQTQANPEPAYDYSVRGNWRMETMIAWLRAHGWRVTVQPGKAQALKIKRRAQ